MSDKKIYLVRVSYLVPVVADSEIDAVQYLLEGDEESEVNVLQDELQQVVDGLNDPDVADPAHVYASSIMVEQEVTAENLDDVDMEPWLLACPWGDSDLISIEERLLGTEEVEEEDV